MMPNRESNYHGKPIEYDPWAGVLWEPERVVARMAKWFEVNRGLAAERILNTSSHHPHPAISAARCCMYYVMLACGFTQTTVCRCMSRDTKSVKYGAGRIAVSLDNPAIAETVEGLRAAIDDGSLDEWSPD